METAMGFTLRFAKMCPHSLGKLIEWKRIFGDTTRWGMDSPHSLGKLIEWKPNLVAETLDPITIGCPHSLGKLIEWKPKMILIVRLK